LLGDTRDNATRIGMADQDDVLQVLEIDHINDVGDVRVQIDTGGEKMNALAQACERRRIDLVPAPLQAIRHPPPAPAARADRKAIDLLCVW
jgi:hypothetical protein